MIGGASIGVTAEQWPPEDSFAVVPLRAVEIDPVVRTVEERYRHQRSSAGGRFSDADWRRISYVQNIVEPNGSVLDVGVGAGQFLNTLALSGRHRYVVGVDRIRYGRYQEFTTVESVRADVTMLPFADDSFDSVVCMEVLEHLEPERAARGLVELRRVTRHQLLVSVPYREPEPISRFHHQRFEAEDVSRIFPAARVTVLDRPRTPWVIVEERLDGSIADLPTTEDMLRLQLEALEQELTELQQSPFVRADRSGRRLARGVRRLARRAQRVARRRATVRSARTHRRSASGDASETT